MPRLGQYAIRREIARSNDIVYEAVDVKMNRRVALKELNFGATPDAQKRERIERFYREARAAGNLTHPNILTIHEVGEDKGRYFIAMEFLEGQSLRDRLKTSGALPLKEAVSIACAVCDALEYAHDRGVIHRDIKPDNVHLLPGGVVKLTDFGIARILHEDQLTVAGQIFGTPSYMAPEQIKGLPLDSRADIFGLGIMLYEMLSGRKPYTGDSVITITHRILNDPLPPLPGVAPALEEVVRRATQKDMNLRIGSAKLFKAALEAATSSNTTLYPSAPSSPYAAPIVSHASQPIMPPNAATQMPNANSTMMYGTQTAYGMTAPPASLPLSQSPYLPPQNSTQYPASPLSLPSPVSPQKNLALLIGACVVGVGVISALVSLAVVKSSQASISSNTNTSLSNPSFPSLSNKGGSGQGTSVLPQGMGIPTRDGQGTFVPAVNPSGINTDANAYRTNPTAMPPSESNGVRAYSQADVTPQAVEAGKIYAQAAGYESRGDIQNAIALYEKASKLAPGSKISEDAGKKSLNLQMNHIQ